MTLKTVIKVSILLIVAYIIYQYTVVSHMPIKPVDVNTGDVQLIDSQSVENTPTESISDRDGMMLLKKVETADFEQLLLLYRADLDGAYAEGYGAAIYREFKEIGTKSSISKLSACPETPRQGVLKTLASEIKISEELTAIEALKKELRSLSDTSKLNENEKGVIDEFLKLLK